MIRIPVLRALTGVTLREYLRTPEAVFWTFGFPLMMALVLGIAFAEGKPAPVMVGIRSDTGTELRRALREGDEGRLELRDLDLARARRALSLGEVDLVVSGVATAPTFELDPQRTGSELARLLVERALARSRGEATTDRSTIEAVDEPGDRYIDFLIAGLIGMNLLGGGLYGIAYNLVNMREKNLLRRLAVTSLGRTEFLLSLVLSRLGFSMAPPLAILAFGYFGFGVPIRGSFIVLLLLIALGSLTFSGIGLVLGSRTKSTETVSGLINLVTMPMWLLGGVFFSNQRFPGFLRDAMPMSWLTDALRGVMLGSLDGSAIAWAAAVLAILCATTFVIAARLFRWT